MEVAEARSLVAKLLRAPSTEAAAHLLGQNGSRLDTEFLLLLGKMIEDEEGCANLLRSTGASKSPGLGTFMASQLTRSNERLERLFVLQDAAVTEIGTRLAARSGSDNGTPREALPEAFVFVCKSCGQSMTVTCPTCMSPRVVDAGKGPTCTHCGTTFSRATCECGVDTVFERQKEDVRPATMTVEALVAHRDRTMKALWAALDCAPEEGDSADVGAQGMLAAKALRALLDSAADLPETVEVGVTWRYLGDACACAARKHDQALLGESCQAYRRAEQILLSCRDERAMAKLNFNFANALRLLKGSNSREQLTEVIQRYRDALAVFRTIGDQGAIEVTQASLTDVLLPYRSLEFKESAAKDRQEIRELAERLERISDDDQKSLGEIQACLDHLKKDRLDDDFRSVMTTLTSQGSKALTESIEEKLRAYDELAAQVRPGADDQFQAQIHPIQAILDGLLKKTVLSEQQRETFQRFAKEVDGLSRQSPQTSIASAERERQLKDMVQRFRSAYLAK